MRSLNTWLVRPQPRLGIVGLLVLLVSGSLAAPLSLDMYTPAIPGMAQYFSTSADIVNLTLVGYYLFLAIGLLLFGPISDKYGRKPVIVGGAAAYLIASVGCALAEDIWMLVVMRVVQALGSGAISATCTAIIKDAVRDEYREQMLSVIQIIFVIGPVAAPLIGAGILSITIWRGTFWVLAAIAAVQLLLALLFEETLDPAKRTHGSILHALGRLGHIACNGAFVVFLFATSSFEIAYMGYVSVGSYIYVDTFGFSAFGYSLFFAAASIACAVGPAVWLKIRTHVTIKRFTTFSLVAGIAIGGIDLLVGHTNAWIFCALFLAFAFFDSIVRPYSVNVLLSQYETDAGSASSLINFSRTFIGSAGMFFVVLPWSNYIVAVSMLMILGVGIGLISWFALLKSPLILKGVKDSSRAQELL